MTRTCSPYTCFPNTSPRPTRDSNRGEYRVSKRADCHLFLDLMNKLHEEATFRNLAINEISTNVDDPDFTVVVARLKQHVLGSARALDCISGTGVSTTRYSAMIKAIGEVAERYSASMYDTDALPLTTYHASTRPCVQPNRFALYLREQYKRPKFPYYPFTSRTLLRWAPTSDLGAGATYYVPASMVFLPYMASKHSRERCIHQQTSSGLAFHSSRARAQLASICEVTERDAIAITWQARMSMPEIRIFSLSKENQSLIRRFSRTGASITLRYLCMDHHIPVVAAIGLSTRMCTPLVAAAADLNPEHAVRRSIEELAQVWFYTSYGMRDVSSKSRRAASLLPPSTKEIEFKDIPNASTGSPELDLAIILRKLEAIGQQVLVSDLTPHKLRRFGLHATRAILPGFHPIFRGQSVIALGGKRLWEVPRKLGQPGLSFGSTGNPLPFPFN